MKWISSALISSAVGLAALSSATTTNAALIERWTVSITNSWSDAEFTSSGPGSFAPEDPYGVFETLPDGSDPRNLSYDVISWGTPRTSLGRSFLAVDETASFAGLRTNNADGVTGAALYHGNYQQRSSSLADPAESWLDSAVLNMNITLFPEGDGTRSQSFEHSIPIDFTETRNTANLASCPGSPWPAGTIACPDSMTTPIEAASFSFVLDDFRYYLTFLFDPQNSQNLLRTDSNEDTATLWTAEGARSRLATRLAITTTPLIGEPAPVPEPASIGLAAAGFGLLGLARLKRRKQA